MNKQNVNICKLAFYDSYLVQFLTEPFENKTFVMIKYYGKI